MKELSTIEEPSIDFAIIAALDLELDALISRFFGSFPNDTIKHGLDEYGNHYYAGHIEVSKEVSPRLMRNILIAPVDPSGTLVGNLRAAITTSKIILGWEPKCVVSFGIAGGFVDDDDIQLGDVVVANAIWYYEFGKITDEESLLRPFPLVPQANLISFAKKISYERSWNENIQYELNAAQPTNYKPQLRIGLIASGEKVIASEEEIKRIKKCMIKF